MLYRKIHKDARSVMKSLLLVRQKSQQREVSDQPMACALRGFKVRFLILVNGWCRSRWFSWAATHDRKPKNICDSFNVFCSWALWNARETFMLISTLEGFFAYAFTFDLRLEEEEFLFCLCILVAQRYALTLNSQILQIYILNRTHLIWKVQKVFGALSCNAHAASTVLFAFESGPVAWRNCVSLAVFKLYIASDLQLWPSTQFHCFPCIYCNYLI